MYDAGRNEICSRRMFNRSIVALLATAKGPADGLGGIIAFMTIK
jgi:hypothetical protein